MAIDHGTIRFLAVDHGTIRFLAVDHGTIRFLAVDHQAVRLLCTGVTTLFVDKTQDGQLTPTHAPCMFPVQSRNPLVVNIGRRTAQKGKWCWEQSVITKKPGLDYGAPRVNYLRQVAVQKKNMI